MLDGPVALVSTLLAFGGSSAASLEAQQAGLATAVISTATSGRDSPVLELSPTGMKQLGTLLCCFLLCLPTQPISAGGYEEVLISAR